jgi:uncharacterized oxidoreductase
METTNNTVLVTGGSAGIGYEIARALSEKGNKVVITGRDEARLTQALTKLDGVEGIVSDVTDAHEVAQLVRTLSDDFPALNMVINNAGKAFVNTLFTGGAFEKASQEMTTNFFSIVRLNELLLPLLQTQDHAAIVNVSSIVALVPNHITATYGASKAALHSYTQSLRIALARSGPVRVFELMPPLVNTDFSQEIGGARGISAETVALEFMQALEQDRFEIHVGRTAQIYQLFLSSPAAALAALNPA